MDILVIPCLIPFSIAGRLVDQGYSHRHGKIIVFKFFSKVYSTNLLFTFDHRQESADERILKAVYCTITAYSGLEIMMVYCCINYGQYNPFESISNILVLAASSGQTSHLYLVEDISKTVFYTIHSSIFYEFWPLLKLNCLIVRPQERGHDTLTPLSSSLLPPTWSKVCVFTFFYIWHSTSSAYFLIHFQLHGGWR